MLRASLLGFTFLLTSVLFLHAQNKITREVIFQNGDFKRASFSKAYWAEERYDNKKLRFKGKFLKCTSRQQNIDVFEKIKIGQWVYYYPSGAISRIENYTNAESCNTGITKEGKWQYFNHKGEIYYEEVFKNDTLLSSVLEIYRDSSLYQSIVTANGKLQTMQTVTDEVSNDYIINGDFELYKYKPVHIVNNGHNKIEELIPGWVSPDGTSSDYYNYNRKVQDVPDHFDQTVKGTGYAGILVYNSRKESYSEHLQTKLKKNLTKGQRYCLTFDVMLSINSGFFTEKFEALLSSGAAYMNSDSLSDSLKRITYQHTFDNTNRWQQLCDCFIADGSERYLTLGLFSLNNAGITKTTERYKSMMDINQAAYYLIDNVSVKAVSEDFACTEKLFVKRLEREKQQKLKNNIFNMLLTGESNAITFKNVQFETNRSDLKQESFPELEQLKYFLENSNVRIEIAGYTDNVGSAELNQTLSLARAQSIKNWLAIRGIEETRLSTIGYGASNFIADNNSEANRQLNRRVEVRLINP